MRALFILACLMFSAEAQAARSGPPPAELVVSKKVITGIQGLEINGTLYDGTFAVGKQYSFGLDTSFSGSGLAVPIGGPNVGGQSYGGWRQANKPGRDFAEKASQALVSFLREENPSRAVKKFLKRKIFPAGCGEVIGCEMKTPYMRWVSEDGEDEVYYSSLQVFDYPDANPKMNYADSQEVEKSDPRAHSVWIKWTLARSE